MKAIETIYNGYAFRSRLEARWAVFFNTLGIPYAYEPEGFDLDGTWYLPDFWLPRQNYWIEIKPIEPTEEEKKKAELLAGQSERKVYIFFGEGLESVEREALTNTMEPAEGESDGICTTGGVNVLTATYLGSPSKAGLHGSVPVNHTLTKERIHILLAL